MLLLAFLLWQVNQKMILTLTATIMYWSLQNSPNQGSSEPTSPTDDAAAQKDGEGGLAETVSSLVLEEPSS